MILIPASGQNTKGDRPQGNRENRFKLPFKKGSKKKGPSGRRIKSKGKSSANSGAAGLFSRKGRSATASHKNVFSQRGPFVKGYSKSPKNRVDRPSKPIRPIVSTQPTSRQKAWRGDVSGHRIRARKAPQSRSSNVYPQSGPFVRGATRTPKTRTSKAVSNKRVLARASKLQGQPGPGPGKRRLTPRSISGTFIARKANNNWKRFPQQRKKGEVAFTKDIAGRKLRRRNYESPRPQSVPAQSLYFGRGKGDRASRNVPKGRNFSSKGRIENPGRPFRIFGITPRTGDRAYRGTVPGRRPGTATVPGEKKKRLGANPARVPGIGAYGINYSGRIRAGRPMKGGGSVSGRSWNNRGQAITPRAPGIGANRVGTFQGNIKSRRQPKGGGSVSGKLWNNRGTAIGVRPPSKQGMQAGGYPGRIKKFSVQPGFANQGEEYTGHLKAYKKPKLAGSASGKVWNNRQQPLERKAASLSTLKTGSYQGNIKASRKPKPAGSISGKLWNNKETPIPTRTPPAGAEKAGKFPGKIKRFTVQPGFADQGEEFTGVIKRPWYRRSYSRNPKAHEKAVRQQSPSQGTYQVGNLQVAVKTRKYIRNKKLPESATPKLSPTESTYETGELQVKVKQRKYGKKPHAAEGALPGIKPMRNTYQADELQVKIKQKPIGKKPHAVEGSLPGIKPTKETVKASEYARGVRRDWKYIRNPSSAKEALRVREPGKAFAKATDYQGNIKMSRFKLFEKSELHPDSKFVKTNRNNVPEERGFFTNIKLWWAKTFKKNDNQPDHLKEKGPRPRYDKGEQGLWYD